MHNAEIALHLAFIQSTVHFHIQNISIDTISNTCCILCMHINKMLTQKATILYRHVPLCVKGYSINIPKSPV